MMIRYLLIFSLLLLTLSGFTQSSFPMIENKGQWPAHVHGAFKLNSGQLYIEEGALLYDMHDFSEIQAIHGGGSNNPDAKAYGHAYKVSFINAQSHSFEGEAPFDTYYNFFLGDDKSKWASKVASYRGAWLNQIYPGIDAHFYSKDGALKYDFIIAPGSKAEDIQLKYLGQENIGIKNGRLHIVLSTHEIIEQAPIAYQEIAGENIRVPCKYVLNENHLSFEFPKGYDPNYALIIDPELIFSTYSGSFSDNFGFTATFDNDGHLYSGSSAFGNGYPTTLGAYQEVWGGGDGQGNLAGTDIAISKYELDGTSMIYSTFIGGANDELPHSLICNDAGELIVLGTSSSPNYPTSSSAYSSNFQGGSNIAPSGVGVQYVNGSDIVITKLSASGASLIASTFLGGSGNDGVNASPILKFNYADEFRGEVELDEDENILIASCTYSNDFPILNGLQNSNAGGLDGIITKLNPELSEIIWSTYYGGSGDEGVYSLAVSDANDIAFCGGTTSANLNFLNNWEPNYQGGSADGFLGRIQGDGSSITAGTYIGSPAYDQSYFVELDGDNQVHIYGQTQAPGSTFIFNADYGTPSSGMHVAKFSDDLNTLIWSTVFGTGSGEPNLSPTAFLVDVCGKIYLSGWGGSTNTSSNPNTDNVFNMDITPDAFQSATNGSDFYILVIEDDASALVYASYFGGLTSNEHVDGGTSRFDRKGQIYQSVCAGCGSNDDFPIFPANAHSPTNNSNNCNNGVFKFDFELPITIADFNLPPTICANEAIPFINNSVNISQVSWDFGDNTQSNTFSPQHQYLEPGVYEVTLAVSNPLTCNMSDTLRRTIEIVEANVSTEALAQLCAGDSLTIGLMNENPEFAYTWIPSTGLSSPNSANSFLIAENDEFYTLLIDTGVCVDTLYQEIQVDALPFNVSPDLILCNEEEIELNVSNYPEGTSIIWSDQFNFSTVLNDNNNDPDIAITPDGPITYYVSLSTEFCSREAEVNIEFINSQTLIEGDLVACFGDTISLNVLNPSNLLDYSWTSSDAVILSGENSTSITAIVQNDALFTVFADNGNGCTSEDDIFVQVSTLNPNSINAIASPSLIQSDESSVLTANPPGYEYIWSPEEGLNQTTGQSVIASPAESTIYNVQVIDEDCIYDASVELRVLDFTCGPPNVYVPNAFSPNGDEENDVLFVRANFVTDMKLQIFNRWGELVFESTKLSDGWDGTYKGKDADPAVFVYHLTVVCEDGQEYFEKGNITLLR